MKLHEILLEKPTSNKLVIVYGGRFQPFHLGHYEAYKWLTKSYSEDNVWLATSDKVNLNSQSGEISPFNFEEKKELMVTLFGINPRKIVECKNPTFSPNEIFKLYKNYKIIYATAVGKKDEDRYKNNYFFEKLPANALENIEHLKTLDQKSGYYVPMPMIADQLSGTKVRTVLADESRSEAQHKKDFIKFFGKYDPLMDQLIKAKLKDIK